MSKNGWRERKERQTRRGGEKKVGTQVGKDERRRGGEVMRRQEDRRLVD